MTRAGMSVPHADDARRGNVRLVRTLLALSAAALLVASAIVFSGITPMPAPAAHAAWISLAVTAAVDMLLATFLLTRDRS